VSRAGRRSIGRRDVLRCALGAAGCALATRLPWPAAARAEDAAGEPMGGEDLAFPAVEARFYKKLTGKRVECLLCPNRCRVADLERGTCGVRENRDGSYYTLVHSRAAAVHVDPIEKKPLFHFLPGTAAFSIATAGCNMECRFCQNWDISQFRPEQVPAALLPPASVHERARAAGAPSIAYTYSEPTIYFEYMYDTAALGVKSGVRSVMVSAGFIEEQPLQELLPLLAAVKVDLKAFRQDFYDRVSRGQLKVVLRTMEAVRKAGRWLEIVTLLVPTLNDSDEELRDLSRWVKQALGPDVPLHFTRFHPMYRMKNLPRTPASTLDRAVEVARAEGLHFVYVGNLPGHPSESTYCPGCKELLVKRLGMGVEEVRLDQGRCPRCQRVIPGVWR
jgi:pyruvate formate lyase activating enzyme